MAATLFVGNLPYSASEDTIRELFAQFGTVEGVRLPTDRTSGQPRGFGFVEMTSEEDARRAMAGLSGYNLDGRDLRVDLAEERAPRGRGESRGGDGERY